MEELLATFEPDPGLRAAGDAGTGNVSKTYQDELVMRLRNSDYVVELARHVETLLQESLMPIKKDFDKTRLENEQLRRQFAMASMELPLAVSETRDISRPESSTGQQQWITPPAESTLSALSAPRTNTLTGAHANTLNSPAEEDLSGRRLSNASASRNKKVAGFAAERGSPREDKAEVGSSPSPQVYRGNSLAPNDSPESDSKLFVYKNEKAGVFVDIDNMKEQLRARICRKPYNVSSFYYEEGHFQWIAKSVAFEQITLAVISINAIWIAFDTDLNKSASLNDAAAIFQVAEYSFFVYFMFEWAVRFGAFEHKWNCMRDRWFIFDSTLVLLMLFDIISAQLSDNSVDDGKKNTSDASILKLLRMTRLTRMARMARLMATVPELTILVKGMWVAGRSVFFTLCLLSMLIYVFSVTFRQLTDGTPIGELYFRNVPYGMKSLLLYGTIPDMADIVDNTGHDAQGGHFLLGALMLLFILLGSLTIMNMLVGILVEVVSVVSAVEKEDMKLNFVKTRLFSMIRACGKEPSEDFMLTREDFHYLLLEKGAAQVFKDIGIDPVDFLDLSEYLYDEADPQGLTFREFLDVVLQMRLSNTATVKDIVDLRRVICLRLQDTFEKIMNRMETMETLWAHRSLSSPDCLQG